MPLRILFLASLFMNSSWALDLSKVDIHQSRPMNAFSFSKSAIAIEQERLNGGISRYLIDFGNEEINSNPIMLESVLQQRPIIAKRRRKALYEFTEISKLFDHVYLNTKITVSPSQNSYLYKIPLKGIYSPNGNQAFVVSKKKNYEFSLVNIVEIQNDFAVVSSKVRLEDIAISHLAYLAIEIESKEDNK